MLMLFLAATAGAGELCDVLLAGARIDAVRSALATGDDPNELCRWKEQVPAHQTLGGILVGIFLPVVSWPFLGEEVGRKRRALPLVLAMGASDPEVAVALLDAGARPYAGALDAAVARDRWTVAERLVDAGAHPTLTTLDVPLAGDVDRLARAVAIGLRLDGVTEITDGGRLLSDGDVAAAFLDAGLPAPVLVEAAAARGTLTVLDLALGRAPSSDPRVAAALEQAALAGRWDRVERLSAHGAPWEVPGHDAVLTQLVARGTTRGVAAALRAGADPGARTASGASALQVAVDGGRADLVALLLDAGADPNAVGGDGQTALARAAQAGRADLVRRLLTAGADPDAGEPRPLAAALDARKLGVAEVLLGAGAGLDDPGLTALLDPDRASDLRLLLGRGLSPTRRLDSGDPLPVVAARLGWTDALGILAAAGADLDQGVLAAAITAGQHGVVDWLVERGSSALPAGFDPWRGADPAMEQLLCERLGLTPPPDRLADAVRANDEARVRRLLAAGADPDGVPEGPAPIELASSPQLDLVLLAAGAQVPARLVARALATGDLGRLERLGVRGAALDPHWSEVHDGATAAWMLDRGADPTGADGAPPLHIAAAAGDVGVLKVLVGAGAPLEARDTAGRTALDVAVAGGASVAVDALLEAGAAYTGAAIRADAAACRTDRLGHPWAEPVPWQALRPIVGRACRREVRQVARGRG